MPYVVDGVSRCSSPSPLILRDWISCSRVCCRDRLRIESTELPPIHSQIHWESGNVSFMLKISRKRQGKTIGNEVFQRARKLWQKSCDVLVIILYLQQQKGLFQEGQRWTRKYHTRIQTMIGRMAWIPHFLSWSPISEIFYFKISPVSKIPQKIMLYIHTYILMLLYICIAGWDGNLLWLSKVNHTWWWRKQWLQAHRKASCLYHGGLREKQEQLLQKQWAQVWAIPISWPSPSWGQKWQRPTHKLIRWQIQFRLLLIRAGCLVTQTAYRTYTNSSKQN